MATGRVMKQRQQRVHDTCPLCDGPDEHLVQILTCPHDTCVDLRTSLLTELRTWLEAEDTQEDIATFLVQGLKSWFDDPYGDEIPTDCDDLTMNRILGVVFSVVWVSANRLDTCCGTSFTLSDARCARHLHDSQAIHNLTMLARVLLS